MITIIRNNKEMRQYILSALFMVLIGAFASCENQDFDYSDFEYQSVYFPYQYPVRTLSLGNDAIDNSLDKEHQFYIGINVGGLYGENPRDWQVDFQLDEALVVDYLVNGNGDTLMAMPEEYYSLSPGTSVTIPQGSFSGLIEVQLSDAFFEDTIAITGQYVLPLKITGTDADTILSGKPAGGVSEPNPHVATDWDGGILYPKDYTLFAVKYVNPYHGKWLRRSTIYVYDSPDGNLTDTIQIRNEYTERDQVIGLETTGLTTATSNYLGNLESHRFEIEVDPDTRELQLRTTVESDITATGTGEYIEFTDEIEQWGGKFRDALYLDYSYVNINDAMYYEVYDTLVFRDRQIKMEDARPLFVEP